MRFRTIKHLKGRTHLKWETGAGDDTVTHELKSKEEPEPEFTKAIEGLRPDVAGILEETKTGAKKIEPTGLQISYDSKSGLMAVVFTAKKKLDGGRSIAINTPQMREPADDGAKGSYIMSDELTDKVTRLHDLAKAYIGGARAQTGIAE